MGKNMHGRTIRTTAVVDAVTGEPVPPLDIATGFPVYVRSAVKSGVGKIRGGAFSLKVVNQGKSNAIIAGFSLPAGAEHTFTCPTGGVLAPIRYYAVHTQLQFIATTGFADFML